MTSTYDLAGHEHRRRRALIADVVARTRTSDAAARPPRREPTARATETLRAVAEHEAAHAVVANYYGCPVLAIEIGHTGRGHTRYTSNAIGYQDAAITAAGDLWQREFGTVAYRDLACSDLAVFERAHGLRHLGRANAAARRILAHRTLTVRNLADQLVQDYLDGGTTFSAPYSLRTR